ncbi:MAG: DUF6044 family protein [Lachnospiraceae bacterium]|nr:DUF6044 family protein [Lachnospiraceae bacterium]
MENNKKRYLIPSVIIALLPVIILLIAGKNSVIAIRDNLDLCTPMYMMLKNKGKFFLQDVGAPFLGGIYRDILPSEINIYSVLYMLLPGFYAYAAIYLVRGIVALFGMYLLGKELPDAEGGRYTMICGAMLAVLPILPYLGIYIAALPFLAFLLIRAYKRPRVWVYILLLFFPVFSDLLYIGISVTSYLFVYSVYRSIKDKRFRGRLFGAWLVLLAGYAGCSYRLIRFTYRIIDNKYTLVGRESYVNNAVDIILRIIKGITGGDELNVSIIACIILPCIIAIIYFILVDIKIKKAEHVLYFKLLALIITNSIIAGVCAYKPINDVISRYVLNPMGQGYVRTDMMNPFIWLVIFACVLTEAGEKIKRWVPVLIGTAMAVAMILIPAGYNDAGNTLYSMIGAESGKPTYEEYFEEDLMSEVMDDLDYSGEWVVTYGISPSVAEYSGMKTVDGNIGSDIIFFSDDFKKIVGPAIEANKEAEKDFEEFRGYRLYSAEYGVLTDEYGRCDITSDDLNVGLDNLKDYCCRYIISAVEIENTKEAGITEVASYKRGSGKLYVYKPVSRYMEKEHSDIAYEDRLELGYDLDEFDAQIDEMNELAKEAVEYKEKHDMSDEEICDTLDGERVMELYESSGEIFTDMSTCYSMAQIRYYQNVTDDELSDEVDEIYEDILDYYDLRLQALRELSKSSYHVVLSEKLGERMVEALAEYEDMTDEEKERDMKLQDLQQDYEKASMEEYSYRFKGEDWTEEMLDERMDELDRDDIYEIYMGIDEERGNELGEIYLDILKLCHEIADAEGYDNYAEYMYTEGYYRDFSVDDVKTLCKDCRESCGRYITRAERIVSKAGEDPGYLTEDDRATFEAILPYMKEIDPELGVSMQHLLDYNLFDLKLSDTKPDKGFTVGLEGYGDAFIFDSPYGLSRDFFTYVHEFGHYNAYYYGVEGDFESRSNLDVAEIQSQGLEMLFVPYYGELFDEDVAFYLEASNVYSAMSAVYDSCLITEFEIYAHEHPDSTVKELARYASRLYEDYGYGLPGDTEEVYFWTSIPHIFVSPLYYISYATSAAAALEIYDMADTNRNVAVEKYMEISSLKSYWAFKETLDYLDMQDIFAKGAVKDIFKKTVEILDEKR